jgi:hypothetical protein
MDLTGLFSLKEAIISRRLRRRQSFEDRWLVAVVVAEAYLSRALDFFRRT